jgi:CPA2 family monovalent cation:H+ antiporter-2
MEIPLLTDIVIILVLSIGILFMFLRLKMPALIGFFLTGILAGPHGLGLVKAVHEVEVMAEIGVVLLLFTIGIEFSINQLLRIKKSVLLGGSLQVLLTTGVTFLAARWFGLGIGQSVFLGFLLSLSSTAIVLKLLQERAEVNSPHGRTTLGILIFQDIVIVPMMLLTPLLGSGEGNLAPGSSFSSTWPPNGRYLSCFFSSWGPKAGSCFSSGFSASVWGWPGSPPASGFRSLLGPFWPV